MRKVSIALRRLGVDDYPSLTQGEVRALKRQKDSFATDLDDFLQEMLMEDQETAEEAPPPGSNGDSGSVDADCPQPGLQVDSEGEPQREVASPPSPGEVPDHEAQEQSASESTVVSESYSSSTDEPGHLRLYSRRANEDGFSVTFKLKSNGGGRDTGELTVYSHASETQLSGLDGSLDSAFAVPMPAASRITLGSGDRSRGWEQLTLKGPPEIFCHDEAEETTEPVPKIPVPDEEPGSLWAVPLEIFAEANTRIAFTNSVDLPTVVRVYLLDRKGNKLAGTLDPKLNPLPPGAQVVESIDRFFPELTGLTEFYGTIVVRVEQERQIWAMGVIGDDPENLTIRRALNMNVDLEGIKAKMSRELEEIAARELVLQQQMSHLEVVLQLAGTNGDSAGGRESNQSPAQQEENSSDESA